MPIKLVPGSDVSGVSLCCTAILRLADLDSQIHYTLLRLVIIFFCVPVLAALLQSQQTSECLLDAGCPVRHRRLSPVVWKNVLTGKGNTHLLCPDLHRQ